jgi:SET domain
LSVPLAALRTAQTVPKAISRKLADITVHGLLAVDLSFDTSQARAPWRAVLPTSAEMGENMPFRWEPALQGLLPPASQSLLQNQQRKFKKDWSTASKAFPRLSQEVFIQNWLIVNTRTFYWVTPGVRKVPRDDCMALNPFADYFNHADDGCTVAYGSDGFKILTDRDYEEHEEIYISYGNHSSDFLLAEYGFVPLENKWDEVQLDNFIFPELSPWQRGKLQEIGYLGNYVLDQEMTVCHRTQVVLRLLCVPLRRWLHFVNGQDDGQRDQVKVDQILLRLLKSYVARAEEVVKHLGSMSLGSIGQRESLIRRWTQVHDLLVSKITEIGEK